MSCYPEAFESYWETTASRHGRRIGKRATYLEWVKIIKAELADEKTLERASKAYTRHCDKSDTFAKDPERFLRQGIWEDFADEPEPVEMVRCSAEVARAYYVHRGRQNMVDHIDRGNPADWALIVPKPFLEQWGQANE